MREKTQKRKRVRVYGCVCERTDVWAQIPVRRSLPVGLSEVIEIIYRLPYKSIDVADAAADAAAAAAWDKSMHAVLADQPKIRTWLCMSGASPTAAKRLLVGLTDGQIYSRYYSIRSVSPASVPCRFPVVVSVFLPASCLCATNSLSTSLSQKSETVTQKCDCLTKGRKRRLSPNSATVAVFCDSLTFVRQSHFSATVWTGLKR